MLIRYQCALVERNIGCILVLLIGTATIIIAGASALFEIDMKKVVALSTLSHLGLIISGLGIQQWAISYFHILTHAFSKALLFMRVGNLIHSGNDYQDLRLSKLSAQSLPISSSLLISTNLRLSGIPFFAGFYSKDIWLEVFLMIESPSFIYLMFIVGVGLSCIYPTRLLFLLLIRATESIRSTAESEENIDFKIAAFILWYYSLFSGAALS